ncbi:MAG: D-cysteine desulfhydrase family protein [Anaerolineaceae bacterium]|nr:D-cysteine desulfhydrase family protein [Anaerolineaceae bacterium]
MKHCQFANLPTPIQHLERIGEKIGYPNLFIKRDDLTGLEFGGNKTRKLEYVIADVLHQKAEVVVTVGGLQSNHVRQTAAICARYGLECVLILHDGESEDPPSGNLFLNQLFGAKIVKCSPDKMDTTVKNVMEEKTSSGKSAYFIPLGASTPIGAYAYKKAFDEMLAQDNCFDRIVLACGSGGTQAGLLHGARCSSWRGKVYGVSILFDKSTIVGYINQLLKDLSMLDGEPVQKQSELIVDDTFLGQGYGVMGELEKEAILLFAKTEGVLLDPVYTGRAAGAMLKFMENGSIKPEERILFWHTGGTPALFCEKYRKQLVSN